MHNSCQAKWKIPDKVMVGYKTFSEFQQLLKCYDLPAIQLYDDWEIYHLCYKIVSIFHDRYFLIHFISLF